MAKIEKCDIFKSKKTGGVALKVNKRITIGIAILILFVILIIIIVNGVTNMSPKKALENFANQIKEGNINDISLTIYCSYIFAHYPLSVEDLINHEATIKVVVDGEQLAEYLDLLKQLANVDLIPVKNKSRIDASIYYFFEDKKGRKIFDVTMWGICKDDDDYDRIFINGKEFKANDIFLDIIDLFVHE